MVSNQEEATLRAKVLLNTKMSHSSYQLRKCHHNQRGRHVLSRIG